jgi:hypothetical protein
LLDWGGGVEWEGGDLWLGFSGVGWNRCRWEELTRWGSASSKRAADSPGVKRIFGCLNLRWRWVDRKIIVVKHDVHESVKMNFERLALQ